MTDSQLNPSDDEIIGIFLQICHQNHYPEKTNIIVPGDQANTLHYIIDGSLSISMAGDDHRNYILSYLNRGDFIGEMGLFVPSHQREVLIQTRTPCLLANVSYPRLWEALENELKDYAVDFLKFVGQKISLRLLKINRKVLTLSSMDVQGRISRTLLELCNEPDATPLPDGIQIKITREELSRLVGCSRELAGKTLKAFEERGMIITKGRNIIIPDQSNLEG